VTCIQKEEEVRSDKYNHRTIIRIPDKLWDDIRIILPKEKPFKTIGRPVVPYRKVLDGILYILRTGCQWKMLPKEYGSGSIPVTVGSRNGINWMFSKRNR
jgi:transposase